MVSMIAWLCAHFVVFFKANKKLVSVYQKIVQVLICAYSAVIAWIVIFVGDTPSVMTLLITLIGLIFIDYLISVTKKMASRF